MPRPRLILNAFTMSTVTHVAYGLWRRPDSDPLAFARLDPWVDLARTLERGAFDSIFFADGVGIYDEHRGGQSTYVREALQIPIHDATTLVSAIAHATERLGIVVTGSVLQEHPFQFARKLSTLDHLTDGRIGWNIVTSAQQNAARNFGLSERVEHDERYRWAEEYVEVAYKLWEGSWEDDAVLVDREHGVFADPAKVHRIDHEGPRYRVQGPHLALPSPQRTPVLFQAGTSEAGRSFAARHAEGTFITAASPDGARGPIADLRRRAVAAGRRAEDVKVLQGLSFVVGSTEEEARRRADELDEHLSVDGLLAHRSGVTGVDFGRFAPDAPIAHLAPHVQGVRSAIESLIDAAPPGTTPTVADFVESRHRQLRVVGTPEQIADRLETWQDAGVDGINVQFLTTPGSYEAFVDHVVPELRRRGLAQHEYGEGSFRERLFGEGPRLPARHAAHAYRTALGPSLADA